MFRSLSAAALALLLGGAAEPTQPPLAGETPVNAPVLDIDPRTLDVSGKVLDITERTSNLDESVTNETSGRQRTIIVAADVLFAFDKATLSGKAKSRLDQAADVLKKEAQGKPVSIDGYTDSKGSDSYNLDLSKRRAEAVRDRLAELVPGVQFSVAGHGEADPVAPNTLPDGKDNPEGRAKNRRVEISFTK